MSVQVPEMVAVSSGGAKVRSTLQRFGGFLAGMVIPNIAAFIAWGLITAFFIPTGWWPNAKFAQLVGPMVNFLLPLLIGYTGGRLVYDKRGAVVGAIATAGVAIGSPVPMFIGAMVMGPLAAYLMKAFDRAVEGKIPTGFEMLVNNFSAGILGAIVSLLGFSVVGPVMSGVSEALGSAASWVTAKHLLPFIAIFIEPGKVLFLNNAINHGILAPLGIQQAKEFGKSVFFLLESDPGPGLGILLAYWIFGKGMAKRSAPSAIIIQFLGGIHEVYFPYILMRPVLILAAIGGGLAADATFVFDHAGLVATPSPGSIFAEIAMSPKGGLLPVLAGIFVGAAVSFLIAAPLLKATKEEDFSDDSLNVARSMVQDMKLQSKGAAVAGQPVAASATTQQTATAEPAETQVMTIPSEIIFACEAGMGSSAMGASILRKNLKDAGFDIKVEHRPVNQLPADAQVVFTQRSLADRAKQVAPHAYVYVVENFLDKRTYEAFVNHLKQLSTAGDNN